MKNICLRCKAETYTSNGLIFSKSRINPSIMLVHTHTVCEQEKIYKKSIDTTNNTFIVNIKHKIFAFIKRIING